MQKPAAALAEHHAALALIEPLVAKAPDYAEWRQDLAWVRQQIAALESPSPQGRGRLRRIWRGLWGRG
ncbi:hypothetical protein [Methylomagnum ishizawai]|uniref:hypothetical protein n=1 Tax=Methylomagnum ishizawai TaxID=1760988 RepID=UPI001C816808|nr:hypothetical protein [Methylomagnum ishizawai]